MPSAPPTFLPFGSSLVNNTKLVFNTIAGFMGNKSNNESINNFKSLKNQSQNNKDSSHSHSLKENNNKQMDLNNFGPITLLDTHNPSISIINKSNHLSAQSHSHSHSLLLGMVETLDLACVNVIDSVPSLSINLKEEQKNNFPLTIKNILNLVENVCCSARRFLSKSKPLILCVGPNALIYAQLAQRAFQTSNFFFNIHVVSSGEEVSSLLYQGGIVCCEDASALVEVDEALFDVCLTFNLAFSSFESANRFIKLTHRTLRQGGALAGTGIFIKHKGDESISLNESNEINNLDAEHENEQRVADVQWSLRQLRDSLINVNMDVHTAIDLSLETDVYYAQTPLTDAMVSMALNPNPSPSLTSGPFPALNFQRLPYGSSWSGGRFLATKAFSSVSPSSSLNRIIPRTGSAESLAELSFQHERERVSEVHNSSASSSPRVLSPSTSLDSLNTLTTQSSLRKLLSSVRPTILVSGTSMGLPARMDMENGEAEPFFSNDSVARLEAGKCLISHTSSSDKQSIVDMNSYQLVKCGEKRVKKFFHSHSEVLQVCGKVPSLDIVKQYAVPSHIAETLDSTYKMAIAAGLEALADAGIEVYGSDDKGNRTIIGLPEEMRDDTGVIFASSFPCLDSCVEEVTKKVTAAIHAELASANPPTYEYDRKLLFKLLVMANCQLAELIKARGPNTHINAACAGTTQALSVASDWIALGRCRRVIVISADNATSSNLFPYIGTGFLGLGAATVASSPEMAARPFDAQRSGMILGAGAVGLVLTGKDSSSPNQAQALITSPLSSSPLSSNAEISIVASHVSNSASHACLMDKGDISKQLGIFLDRVESDYGITRNELASDLLYIAHETGTQACAAAECFALKNAFGDKWNEILISNCKGYTGHPMGVAFEDVIAVWSLKTGKVLPVPEFTQPRNEDSKLGLIPGQLVTKENIHHSRNYVLRFAAGFGSQLVYILFKRNNH